MKRWNKIRGLAQAGALALSIAAAISCGDKGGNKSDSAGDGKSTVAKTIAANPQVEIPPDFYYSSTLRISAAEVDYLVIHNDGKGALVKRAKSSPPGAGAANTLFELSPFVMRAEGLRRLKSSIDSANFFTLEDAYENAESPETPQVNLMVRADGKTKSIHLKNRFPAELRLVIDTEKVVMKQDLIATSKTTTSTLQMMGDGYPGIEKFF